MVNVKGKWILTTEEINTVISLYQTKSISFIAKQFGVDRCVIKRILLSAHIKIKNLSESHRFPVDESFFQKIDTEEKAYWLGFIYADGYITKRKNTKTFGVKLHISDINHLQKLKKALKSEHKIIIEHLNTTFGQTTACALCIANCILVDGLYTQGVLYNKSKILIPPTLQQVPTNLIPHFIRGYFDGDGSIYCTLGKRSKTPSWGISFIGTEKFLNWILQILIPICGTTTKVCKYKNKDIFELKIGGNTKIKQIYHYFYDNATVFLDRKKEKFEELRRTFNDYNSPPDKGEGIV